jgi:hypothetical protein
MKFQYHTGPIKSGGYHDTYAVNIAGFNTTLVQLKGNLLRLVLNLLRCVSIPHWSNLRTFQYHTGPIKSPLVRKNKARFNTTLVQLKEPSGLAVPDSQACFNTTLVQLKVLQRAFEITTVSIPHWSN